MVNIFHDADMHASMTHGKMHYPQRVLEFSLEFTSSRSQSHECTVHNIKRYIANSAEIHLNRFFSALYHLNKSHSMYRSVVKDTSSYAKFTALPRWRVNRKSYLRMESPALFLFVYKWFQQLLGQFLKPALMLEPFRFLVHHVFKLVYLQFLLTRRVATSTTGGSPVTEKEYIKTWDASLTRALFQFTDAFASLGPY